MKQKLVNLDWDKWMTNTLVFFVPVAVLYLAFVQSNITKDGFQMSDFTPTSEAIGAMILYLINTTLDLLKKYRSAQ